MNCILYVLDSLRADHLSCYGYERETDPNLMALAEDGVVGKNVYSQAIWTPPSAGSIISGTYPAVHRSGRISDKLAPVAPSLPMCMKENGSATVAFSTIWFVSRDRGFDRNFDEFYENYESSDPDLPEKLNSQVTHWLENNYKRDFFVFVWSVGTHTPYFLPGEGRFADPRYAGSVDGSIESLRKSDYEDEERVRNLYDSVIYHNDYCIGGLLRKLHELGIYDKTLFAVTADHGEVFSEHGRFDHIDGFIKAIQRIPFLNSLPEAKRLFKGRHGFLGHSSVLPYEELLHVPLIIKFPNSDFSGKTLNALSQSIDIMPTILDYMGIDIPGDVQGRSILPVLKGQETQINEFAYSESQTFVGSNTYYSIQDSSHKLIGVDSNLNLGDLRQEPYRCCYSIVEYLHTPQNVLFDRTEEGKNISRESPDIVRKLEMELCQWKAQNRLLANRLGTETEEVRLDHKVQERLRNLGYMD